MLTHYVPGSCYFKAKAVCTEKQLRSNGLTGYCFQKVDFVTPSIPNNMMYDGLHITPAIAYVLLLFIFGHILQKYGIPDSHFHCVFSTFERDELINICSGYVFIETSAAKYPGSESVKKN